MDAKGSFFIWSVPLILSRISLAEEPQLSEAGLLGQGDLKALSIFPPRVEIRGADRLATLVVTGAYSSGGARDLTQEAVLSVSDSAVAAVDPQGILRPLRDGAAELVASVGGIQARAPLVVSHTSADLPINFSNDIVPIFSKNGCNAGGCHGKSGGQNGFQLSLFGYTPAFDFAAITMESRGRRVFPAAPEHSLLLRKATGSVPHGGGQRFPVDSPDYRLLHRWMRSGMPFGKPDDPVVERISVYPRFRALAPGGRQQLAVTAFYSDGKAEDVTQRAQFTPGEADYLHVSASGLVAVSDLPGQGTVMARYKGHVALFRAMIPSGLDISRLPFPPEESFIDHHVFERLKVLGIPPSGLCLDSEFLRRASLDVCGALPSATEAAEFLDDRDPQKRRKLIDRLLERPEYASYFALQWGDLLRNRRGGEARAAPQTIAFHQWIHDSLLLNKPFDLFAREILCAEGSVSDNPCVAWYRSLESPKLLVDDTAQVFLGTRIQCARCHHHPFEKWGQEDYWRFANFFSRVTRKDDSNSRSFALSLRRGDSRFTDDEPTSASFRKTYTGLQLPGGPKVEESSDEDPRQALSDWLVSPANALFARGIVNRYWKHFFGRGIVEPEDDLRETNPPSNADLLDALAKDFTSHGYDLKHLIRTICASATYQLSSIPNGQNARDRQNFCRYQPRRLPAEVLLDAMDQVTAKKTRFQNVLREARAIELPDETSRTYFLDVFGKPARNSACACERSEDITLSQVIHLLNSREVEEKVSAGDGRAAQLAKDPRRDEEKIEELFLAAFSRRPGEDEMLKAVEFLAERARRGEKDPATARRRAWEDLLWAFVNTKEFFFRR